MVYHEEAFEKASDEQNILVKQYAIMETRAYRIICNPAMMITWTFGIIMMALYGMEWLKSNPWMHVKLLLLIILTAYHLYCKRKMKGLQNGQRELNSFQLRLLNEVPTLLLIAIVILAVYKNLVHFGLVLSAILIIAILLYVFSLIYRRIRMNKS